MEAALLLMSVFSLQFFNLPKYFCTFIYITVSRKFIWEYDEKYDSLRFPFIYNEWLTYNDVFDEDFVHPKRYKYDPKTGEKIDPLNPKKDDGEL